MDIDPLVVSYIKASLSKLARFFFLANAKIHRKKNRRLNRITFKKTSGLSSTYLSLISTKQLKSMHYSIQSKEYFIEIWLSPRSEFYILQQGRNYLIDSFPQHLNSKGNLVNLTPEYQKFYVPALSTYSRRFLYQLHFESAACSVSKLLINEDSFFSNSKALGIADGIGSQKRETGISSHFFSHELINRCESHSKDLVKEGKSFTCKELLRKAYSSVEAGGSSTVLLAVLLKKQLSILNLGDSGLILVRFDRRHKIVFQTTPKLHSSLVPYQLAKKFSDKQILQHGTIKTNLEKTDDIEDADEFLISTLPGDFVVLGSDGLWDNLHPSEIIKILDQHKSFDLQNLAAMITKIAKIRSVGMKQSRVYGDGKSCDLVGGKVDDITVLVARVWN